MIFSLGHIALCEEEGKLNASVNGRPFFKMMGPYLIYLARGRQTK